MTEKLFKKLTEFQKNVGHHYIYSHMHKENTRRRGEGKRKRKIFKEIIAKIFPNLIKNNSHIQKAQRILRRININ